MTTTTFDVEDPTRAAWVAWFDAHRNYRLARDRASPIGGAVQSLADDERWVGRRAQAAQCLSRMIDTAAPTVEDALTKLRTIIADVHMDGPRNDIDDATVRADYLADPMLDGPWPLLRVLEDLERLLTKVDPALERAARRVVGYEGFEAAGNAIATHLEAEGRPVSEQNALLNLIDGAKNASLRAACETPARSLADIKVKAAILSVAVHAAGGPAEGGGFFGDAERLAVRLPDEISRL